MAAGGPRISANLERSLENFSEGGDITDPPGSGATMEGGATVPGRDEKSCRCPAQSYTQLSAALLQGSSVGRPTEGVAGDPGQK